MAIPPIEEICPACAIRKCSECHQPLQTYRLEKANEEWVKRTLMEGGAGPAGYHCTCPNCSYKGWIVVKKEGITRQIDYEDALNLSLVSIDSKTDPPRVKILVEDSNTVEATIGNLVSIGDTLWVVENIDVAEHWVSLSRRIIQNENNNRKRKAY